MRLAFEQDIPRLQTVYDEAIEHAESVGRIDWPKPFPAALLQEFIDVKDLYGFDRNGLLVAAVRLSKNRDARIWEDDGRVHTYLGKAATSSKVRSQHYFEKIMFPSITETLDEQAASIRLDCLADNVPLQNFYKHLGFSSLGEVTFYSERQGADITVTRMELEGF